MKHARLCFRDEASFDQPSGGLSRLYFAKSSSWTSSYVIAATPNSKHCDHISRGWSSNVPSAGSYQPRIAIRHTAIIRLGDYLLVNRKQNDAQQSISI